MLEVRESIARAAKELGLKALHLEHHAALVEILHRLSSDKECAVLLLKGGTALHGIWLHKRLSVDLDFSVREPQQSEALGGRIRKAVGEEIRQIEARPRSLRMRFRLVGPLGTPMVMHLEVNVQESPLLEPSRVRFKSHVGASPEVNCLDLKEILAEKMRALRERREAKDCVDIFWSLEAGLLPHLDPDWWAIVGRKLASREARATKPAGGPSWPADAVWRADLGSLVHPVPNYSDVRRRVEALVQDAAAQGIREAGEWSW